MPLSDNVLSNEATNIDQYKEIHRPYGLAAKSSPAEIFESPLEVSPSFTWRPEDLTKDEATLLLKLCSASFEHRENILNATWKYIHFVTQLRTRLLPFRMSPWPLCLEWINKELIRQLTRPWSSEGPSSDGIGHYEELLFFIC
ncbi:hypothetical protein PGTUg99_012015 [Puccinia graminis f. sp. tritici]|uniref:Uncharacterized protein n=1 Tax=Puccinia graminis f. sp. tritici TaxID=56615 RepID=A0A5B0RWR4_PUCGR|nr:hypothetical protein PGTUg99_012015 [Puccinia graminis f. sp. tritici]